MLNIYARTFMIATMTDSWAADRERARPLPRRRAHPGGHGWLGGAWRRLAGREE